MWQALLEAYAPVIAVFALTAILAFLIWGARRDDMKHEQQQGQRKLPNAQPPPRRK